MTAKNELLMVIFAFKTPIIIALALDSLASSAPGKKEPVFTPHFLDSTEKRKLH